MAKKDLEKVSSGAMVVPDYIKEGDHRGSEHIGKDDIQMPRLTLAQGLSPQIVPTDPKYIEGLKLGEMFNNLTNEIYGVGPLEMTIIRGYTPRGIEFYPRSEGGGIKNFNVPLGDPRMEFGANGEVPIATKFYEYIAMLLPKRELIALSMKGTTLKVARQLNSLLKFRNIATFAGKYSIRSVMDTNPKGTYAIFVINAAGFVDEEIYAEGSRHYEALKDKMLSSEGVGDEDIIEGEVVTKTSDF